MFPNCRVNLKFHILMVPLKQKFYVVAQLTWNPNLGFLLIRAKIFIYNSINLKF